MSLNFVPEGDDIAAYWVKAPLEWFYKMLSHIEDFSNDELFKWLVVFPQAPFLLVLTDVMKYYLSRL